LPLLDIDACVVVWRHFLFDGCAFPIIPPLSAARLGRWFGGTFGRGGWRPTRAHARVDAALCLLCRLAHQTARYPTYHHCGTIRTAIYLFHGSLFNSHDVQHCSFLPHTYGGLELLLCSHCLLHAFRCAIKNTFFPASPYCILLCRRVFLHSSPLL